MSEQNKNTSMRQRENAGPRPGGGRGGPPGMMTGPKAKDFKGSTKKLLSYLKPFHLAMILILIVAALSTVFSIIGPKVLALATDELAKGVMAILTEGEGAINFAYIGQILLVMLGLYLLSAVFSYVQGFTMAGISAKVSYNLRQEIMQKINKLPLGYFHKTTHGEVLSRITNDVDTISSSLGSSVTQLITSLTMMAGVLIMMLSISWKLTLVALCILPVTMILVSGIMKKSQGFFRGQQRFLGDLNGHVEEMYGGHTVIKAFGAEERAVQQFDEHNEKLYNAGWKAQFLSGLMQPIMGFIGNIGYVAICVLGASMAASGTMTIGGIQAFIQYVRNFTSPITQIANIFNQLQMTIAAAERVFEFLDEEEETEGTPKYLVAHRGEAEMDGKIRLRGDVQFEHVKFGYEPDQTIIHDFSAKIYAGQKVAIVGPTGAGKTTMVKLLMRFHDIDGGNIYVDGHDVDDFTKRDLRTEFGMVLQDTWLFNGSVMENIRYGRLDASDEEVYAAAKAAQVDHFIRTLPGGYQMELNEDATNVSQGQKQLLTIARALLSDARVMILDEATSSVDTRTEVLIQKAMDNLMKGRTSFVIAHRLSTIKNADLILCMQDGDIVEQGTHEELMDLNGFYAGLYNSQFQTVNSHE